MFRIKTNIVDQRWHKEEKKSQGSKLFWSLTFWMYLWNQTLRVLEKNLHFLWNGYLWLDDVRISCLGLGNFSFHWSQLEPNAWCVSFVCCIHVYCMNIPCMHIGTTHHGIWHLTAQFSLKVATMLNWYCVLLYAVSCLDKNHHVLGIQIK